MNKREKFNNLVQKIEDARVATNEYNIVNIVAVSKYSVADEIKEYCELGQRAFGENRVQDLKSKSIELEEFPISWHFIGRLQKNKINQLIDLNPVLTHSCDSIELANEINKRLIAKNKTMNILLQVNGANEESKAGTPLESTLDIYQEILETCPNIKLKGIMSFGSHSDDRQIVQQSFENVYKIYENLTQYGAKYCSMGMSGDYELAVRCGSNMVRVGSVLFKD